MVLPFLQACRYGAEGTEVRGWPAILAVARLSAVAYDYCRAGPSRPPINDAEEIIQMIVISVAFEAKPDKVAEFKALITEHARRSLSEEPGCRQFDVAQDPKDEKKFMLWEVYDDEKAFEFHRNTPRMAENGKKIPELVTSRDLKILTMLPGDKPKR